MAALISSRLPDTGSDSGNSMKNGVAEGGKSENKDCKAMKQLSKALDYRLSQLQLRAHYLFRAYESTDNSTILPVPSSNQAIRLS